MSKYNFELDLIPGNSMHAIVSMLKPNTQILEFGPAHGRLTKYLKEEMNCKVTIVEIDEEAGNEALKFSTKGFVGNQRGNIENYIWANEIDEVYDYIIFADVLEHLYNTDEVLSKCKKFLKTNGSIIISIPNIAHNSIIIDLMNNKFNYNEIGLLDSTHIRFFTLHSFLNLITKQQLQVANLLQLNRNVGENEIDNSYKSIPENIAHYLSKRNLGEVYQYVFDLKQNIIPIDVVDTINKDYSLCCTCYVQEKDDEDFLEAKTIRSYFMPESKKIVVKLEAYSYIKQLRIDLLEDTCIIKNIKVFGSINGDKNILSIVQTNAINIIRDVYLFTTKDPQIYIEPINGPIDYIIVELDLIDYDLVNIQDYIELSNNLSSYNELKFIKTEMELKDNHIRNIEEQMELKDNHIRNIEEQMELKDNHIRNIEEQMELKDNHIRNIEEQIELKDNHIRNIEDILEKTRQEMSKVKEFNLELSKRIEDCEIQLKYIYSTLFGKILRKRMEK